MKCGEKGWTTKNGTPCGQSISPEMPACIWHDKSPEGIKRAKDANSKGAAMSRLKLALPETFPEPDFSSSEKVVEFSQRMAHVVLTQAVDTKRVAEARGMAKLALDGHSTILNARMVDALERLEHGGAALALLERMQQHTGTSRPLPGRTRVIEHRVAREEKAS